MSRLCKNLIKHQMNGSFHNFPKHNLKIIPVPIIHVINCFNSNHTIKCWQCGIERRNPCDLFCEKCNFLQNPLEKNNYFKLFKLEENFNLNASDLTRKYREMQNILHPDKFSNRTDKEKEISEDFSSLVNKAYDVLQTPLKRAIHLINLKGGNMDEVPRAQDPDFLMEIMELNEEVENADNDEKLIKLNKKSKEMLKKITEEINHNFTNSNIDKAKENIIKMKYYTSVAAHINNLLREKGITE